jgi:hypothetical protein
VFLGPAGRYIDYRIGLGEDDEPAEWARFLDLNTEANLPTFYSTFLLLVLAGTLALRAVLGVAAQRAAWFVMATTTIQLAVDEATSLHERFLDPLGRQVGGGAGALTFAWVIPGAVLAVVAGLALVRTTRVLPGATRRRLGLALGVFVAGALGVEMISGAVLDERGHDRVYLAVTTVEEALELAGVLLALHVAADGITVQRRDRSLLVGLQESSRPADLRAGAP